MTLYFDPDYCRFLPFFIIAAFPFSRLLLAQ